MKHVIHQAGRPVALLELVTADGSLEEVREICFDNEGYPCDSRTYPLDSDEGMLRLAALDVPVDLIRGQR